MDAVPPIDLVWLDAFDAALVRYFAIGHAECHDGLQLTGPIEADTTTTTVRKMKARSHSCISQPA